MSTHIVRMLVSSLTNVLKQDSHSIVAYSFLSQQVSCICTQDFAVSLTAVYIAVTARLRRMVVYIFCTRCSSLLCNA